MESPQVLPLVPDNQRISLLSCLKSNIAGSYPSECGKKWLYCHTTLL